MSKRISKNTSVEYVVVEYVVVQYVVVEYVVVKSTNLARCGDRERKIANRS